MAMVNSYNSKLRKSLPKQIMLKDYLLDDLSSCSSNGFRSFPRRQCCSSTVRFLMEEKQKTLKKTKPKSLLRRASAALIGAAARLLSSAAAAKPSQKSPQPATCLPKSLSRKIKRWRSIKYFAVHSTVSNSVSNGVSVMDGGGKSDGDRWMDFNCDYYLECTRDGLGGTCGVNDVVGEEAGKGKVNGRVGGLVAASESSTPSSSLQNKWQNEEAKEQFSPVSVMDFPSTDEEEVSSPDEVSSPFQSRLACVEGKKKKLMLKLRRFEGLAKLEPIDLSNKFTLSEQTNKSIDSSSQPYNITNTEEEIEVEDQDRDDVVHKALGVLDQTKTTSENYKNEWENILFDFFVEQVSKTNGNRNEIGLISEARDWMNGNPREMFLGWEKEKHRLPYMKDMEKCGDWNIRNIRSLDEHKKEVAFELEIEILALIVDELVLDLIDL